MPSPEFDQLMSECDRLAIELQTCKEPKRRLELLKQMKIVLDAANELALLKTHSATP